MRALRKRWIAWLCLVCMVVTLAGCSGGSGTWATAASSEDAAMVDTATAKTVGTRLFKFVASELASAAIGGVAGVGLGFLLDAIFGNDDSEEMNRKLDEMNAKLDRIINMLQDIENKLDEVLAAISKARADIMALNESLNISEPIDTVQSDYDEAVRLSERPPRHTPREAKEFMHTVLDTNKHDLVLQLNRIHSGIVGNTVGTRGVLRAWTEQAITQLDSGKDVVDCYLTLEHYFSELLGVQAKGLLLVCDAKHLEKTLSERGTRSYGGTAEEYRTKVFMPKIEQQVQLFLECAEEIAMHKTGPSSAFLPNPGKTLTIFKRMDWLACQVCSQFGPENTWRMNYGAHVHLFLEQHKLDRYNPPAELKCGEKVLRRLPINDRPIRRYPVAQYIELVAGPRDDPATAYNSFNFSSITGIGHYERATPKTQPAAIWRGKVAWARCPAQEFQVAIARYDDNFRPAAAGKGHPFGVTIVQYRVDDLPSVWRLGDLDDGNFRNVQQESNGTVLSRKPWVHLTGEYPLGMGADDCSAYIWSDWRFSGNRRTFVRANLKHRLESAGDYPSSSEAEGVVATQYESNGAWRNCDGGDAHSQEVATNTFTDSALLLADDRTPRLRVLVRVSCKKDAFSAPRNSSFDIRDTLLSLRLVPGQ